MRDSDTVSSSSAITIAPVGQLAPRLQSLRQRKIHSGRAANEFMRTAETGEGEKSGNAKEFMRIGVDVSAWPMVPSRTRLPIRCGPSRSGSDVSDVTSWHRYGTKLLGRHLRGIGHTRRD